MPDAPPVMIAVLPENSMIQFLSDNMVQNGLLHYIIRIAEMQPGERSLSEKVYANRAEIAE
jgi:hypothetical protein